MINAFQKNAYQRYQYNSVMSASPQQLLIMLLDGAIKFVRLGREDIKQKDMEGAHYNLSKAQDIVMELDESLDMDYDISQSLSGIYEFIYRQLIEANIKKDIKTLDQVELFLCDLKDTWVEALKTARKAEVQYGGK